MNAQEAYNESLKAEENMTIQRRKNLIDRIKDEVKCGRMSAEFYENYKGWNAGSIYHPPIILNSPDQDYLKSLGYNITLPYEKEISIPIGVIHKGFFGDTKEKIHSVEKRWQPGIISWGKN